MRWNRLMTTIGGRADSLAAVVVAELGLLARTRVVAIVLALDRLGRVGSLVAVAELELVMRTCAVVVALALGGPGRAGS